MGFFDRFYYGKAGKADYTTDDLPANRFQLFWEVLRVRFWSLMRLNLMQLVFWIPFLIVTVWTLAVLNTAPEGAEMLPTDQLMGVLSWYTIFLIPCLLITGPSTAAASYVTRNWARDQHSFIWSDFKDALKANWKQGLCTSAITSVLPFFLYIGYQFYGNLAQTMPIAVVAQALLFMAVLVWALALVFIYPLMVGYEMRMGKLIRNSVMLGIGRLPQAIGIRLLMLLPLLLCVVLMFVTGIAMFVLALYYVLIGFSLQRLVFASFANGVFDKYINPHIEGAPVNMGLRLDDDEDEDEADE